MTKLQKIQPEKNTNVDVGASNANNANVAANTNVATEAKVEANTKLAANRSKSRN